MRTPRIYTSSKLNIQNNFELDDAKALKHVKDVLRMKAGDALVLFNGDGNDYLSSIEIVSKKKLVIQVIKKTHIENESALNLHLLQPLCSSEKMDLCIQKATELGVKCITPFISSRVNINITGERLTKKMQHWQSITQSACEQCGRASIPTINQPVSLNQAIETSKDYSIKLIASPISANINTSLPNQANDCVCAIGPEGGFTQEEVNHAVQQGFNCMSMGPRILRLETAVIASLAYCQLIWGDINWSSSK